jgi:hypothetical protein
VTLNASGRSFAPNYLNDLCLWLRADNVVLGGTNSNSVLQWSDMSGKQATNSFSGSLGTQPTMVFNDANFNGQSSILFNGTSQFLADATFSFGTGPDFFIWTVCKMIGSTGFPMIWSQGGVNELRGTNSTGAPEFLTTAGTAIWGSSTVGATKAYAAWDTTAGPVGISVSNGTPVTVAGTAGHAVSHAVPINIGARPAPNNFANMKVAEFVVCTTMPSASDLQLLQTYATLRYGAV